MTKQRIAAVLVVLAVVCATAYGSTVYGYMRGYGQALSHVAPSQGVEKVVILRALRRGDTASAISVLEGSLDSDIVTWSVRNDDLDRRFSIFPDQTKTRAMLMSRVAAYRADVATAEADRKVRDLILRELAKYPFEKCAPQEGPARTPSGVAPSN